MSFITRSRTKTTALVVGCMAVAAIIACWLFQVRNSPARLTFPPYSERSFPPGITLLPDGRFVVALDGQVLGLWDLETQQQRGLFISDDQGGSIKGLAISPDGQCMATAGGKTVVLWDLDARTQRAVLRGHKYGVMDVAFSPNGRYLASVETDQDTAFLWDLATFEIVGRFPGILTGFPRLAFSPDSKTLAVLSSAEHGESQLSGMSKATTRGWLCAIHPSALSRWPSQTTAEFLLLPADKRARCRLPRTPRFIFGGSALRGGFHGRVAARKRLSTRFHSRRQVPRCRGNRD
jgi:hypothetical protein